MGDIDGSCVVTGAGRGIGRAIATRLVSRGHAVVVTDLDGDAARRTAGEIGAAEGLAQDVRDPDSHRAACAAARRHGPLTAWFNNAGVGHDGTLAELTEDEVRRLVEVNLLGALWGTRAALSAFAEQDADPVRRRRAPLGGGDVVITASLSGLGPVPGLSVYAATKAAVVSLATSVNLETPRQVRVHALCPDGVATDMVEQMRAQGGGRRLVTSGGRLFTPEEVAAEAVALLGSRRVVRTMPGWRAALMRSGALVPSAMSGPMAVFAAQGARSLRRDGRG